MTYKTLYSGDWIAFEPTIFALACCDCGLTHVFKMEFRNGKFGFTIRPDRCATGQIRRRRGIVIRKLSNSPEKGGRCAH